MNKPHGSPLTDLLGLPTASLSLAHVFFGTWLTIIFLNQRADGDFTAERLLQCLPSQAFWHSGQHHHTAAPFGWARVTSVKPSELCTKHSPVTSEGIVACSLSCAHTAYEGECLQMQRCAAT